MNRAEGEVRPRVFFEDFPNIVLYVREVPLERPGLARRAGRGHLEPVAAGDLPRQARPHGRRSRRPRTIQMVLEDGTRHTTKLDDPAAYEVRAVRAARSSRSIRRACSRAPARRAASAR